MSKNLFRLVRTLCFLLITITACRPQATSDLEQLPALPTVAIFPTLTPIVTSIPVNTLTFNPVADSYVDSSRPSNNSGSSAALRTDAAPVVNSYLLFNVQDITGTVTSATLRIYANSASRGGLSIGSVADHSWDEMTITYSNAPAFGIVVGAAEAFSADTWLSIDVTSLVSGNGLLSLVMTSANDTAISFSSREGPNPPQLILNVNL